MKSFTCSQKNCQAIIVNVFAPKVTQMLKEDLDECSYVSIYTDASNHGSLKIFPVLVRYFVPTIGVQIKVMEIEATGGETSEIIEYLVKETAHKFGVNEKIVAYCGDNAKVNFGGITRGGQNNVFARMKSWLPHLLGIGCTAHILHNSLKSACDVLPFDVECVVVIYSYFYIYTTHEEALKSFCEEADVEYFKLLGYAKTRFLALGPAIKRILHLFEPLKNLFLGLKKGEKLLKDFFGKPSSKFWLCFVQGQAELFATHILKIEGDDVTAIEVVQQLENLKMILKTRQEDDFLSPATLFEKSALVRAGYAVDTVLLAKCGELFADALEYIEKWAAPTKQLQMFSWATLQTVPVWKDVEAVMMNLCEHKLYDPANAAQLHTEFTYFKNYCGQQKLEQWRTDKVPVAMRWVEAFKHLGNEDCGYTQIAKIAQYILCLPGSTASVERVFAGMNKTWTNEKSRLKVATLKAILMVKVNLKMTCLQFFNFLKSQPDMLRRISSKEKYILRTASGIEEIEDDSADDEENSSE